MSVQVQLFLEVMSVILLLLLTIEAVYLFSSQTEENIKARHTFKILFYKNINLFYFDFFTQNFNENN